MELVACYGSAAIIKSKGQHEPLLLHPRLRKITSAEESLCSQFYLLGHSTIF
jgi:hypothetical protein